MRDERPIGHAIPDAEPPSSLDARQMNKAIGRVKTRHAAKYIEQLCRHWAHKLEVERSGNSGSVRFPTGVATMTASEDELIVAIKAEDEASVDRLREVVASHLDRFAFREAPLPFLWSTA